ncbi:MAG TPA: hypothetical protein VJB08_06555 [Candidatus Nanoarchaeia archaeon]|nr:hypothetical protein [Candidatus Nanoarchaeia archaeon]
MPCSYLKEFVTYAEEARLGVSSFDVIREVCPKCKYKEMCDLSSI